MEVSFQNLPNWLRAWVRTITTDVNGGSVGPKRLGEQKVLQYDCISKLDREEDPPLVEISKAFPKRAWMLMNGSRSTCS
jgi:hypothetical protein